jgi:hypothetical protein
MAIKNVGLGKKGKTATSRWAEESRIKARESGELPHEFLLRIARGEPIEHMTTDEDGCVRGVTIYPDFESRIDAANQCANYFAPKLTSQQVENLDPVTEMTDEELNRKLAELDA